MKQVLYANGLESVSNHMQTDLWENLVENQQLKLTFNDWSKYNGWNNVSEFFYVFECHRRVFNVFFLFFNILNKKF